MLVLFCISTSSLRVPVAPHLCQHLVLSVFVLQPVSWVPSGISLQFNLPSLHHWLSDALSAYLTPQHFQPALGPAEHKYPPASGANPREESPVPAIRSHWHSQKWRGLRWCGRSTNRVYTGGNMRQHRCRCRFQILWLCLCRLHGFRE